MAKHLLIVGAGHAHLTTLKNLDLITGAGHDATVINPDSYHYYSGMGPGVLSGMYEPAEIRFHVEKMTTDRGGRFIRDLVVEINPDKQTVRTAGGETIAYDVVSFNTGSYVPYPESSERNDSEDFLLPVKPIRNLVDVKKKLLSLFDRKRPKILIGGGGPAGVEIAANIRSLAEKADRDADIILVAGGQLLKQFDSRFREKALTMLKKRRIGILERDKVTGFSNQFIHLLSGVSIQCDIAIMALGVVPSAIFKKSGLPVDKNGGLLVNEYLQSVAYENIFGGGDCIGFQPRELPKVGVYAVRENPFLFENIFNFLEQKNLQAFIPQRKFLLILNMGGGYGLLKWNKLAFEGRTAFALKNRIDKKFMKTFQVSGERV